MSMLVRIFSNKDGEEIEMKEVGPLVNEERQESETAAILKKLKSEEADLVEEAQNLSMMKESLTTKAKEEIEARKSSIQKLKAQITGMKSECEALTQSLNAGLTSL